VPDDEEDRTCGEGERDSGRNREAQDESRRVVTAAKRRRLL